MLGPRWQASGQPAPGPTDTDHREGIGLPSDPIQASRVRACAREEVVGVRDGRERVPTVMTVTRGGDPASGHQRHHCFVHDPGPPATLAQVAALTGIWGYPAAAPSSWVRERLRFEG